MAKIALHMHVVADFYDLNFCAKCMSIRYDTRAASFCVSIWAAVWIYTY